jgi:hypothetical protein
MPAYNFLSQFAESVEDGRKRQTMRPKRKRPTVPGDTLYLYTGMRTKQCRKLREVDCLDVQPVEIEPTFIKLGKDILGTGGMWALARADGFETLRDFYDFFEERYGIPHKVELELIRW